MKRLVVKRHLSFSAMSAALICAAAGLASCGPAPETVLPAQVHVTSAPPGAEVALNGRYEGQTPITLMKVPPGEHLLVLKKTGFREARTTVVARSAERIAVDLNLETLSGLLLIHSQPTGAEVEINNADYGKTPLLLPQMPFGQYRITARLPGHLPKTVETIVADRTPVKIDLQLISDSGRIVINSTPPGASVAVGGVSRGITPFTIETIPSGKHQMSLTMKGYEPYIDEITVEPGDRREFNIALTPLPGSLVVASRPSQARIYLNGQFKGESPISITNISAGEYILRAELRGYEPMTKTNTLAFGEKSTVEFELVKNSGALLISTEPAGVRVYLDGEDMGTTKPAGQNPVSTQMQIDFVPQGSRKLQMTKPGYFDLLKTVEVTPDRMIVLHEKLIPRPVPFVPNVIIRTGPGAEHMFRGIIREEYADGAIRLEIEPGIFKTFRANEIISRESIKTD